MGRIGRIRYESVVGSMHPLKSGRWHRQLEHAKTVARGSSKILGGPRISTIYRVSKSGSPPMACVAKVLLLSCAVLEDIYYKWNLSHAHHRQRCSCRNAGVRKGRWRSCRLSCDRKNLTLASMIGCPTNIRLIFLDDLDVRCCAISSTGSTPDQPQFTGDRLIKG